jgi:hypothetical protein
MRAGVAKSHIRQHAAPGALRGYWRSAMHTAQGAVGWSYHAAYCTRHTNSPAVLVRLLLQLLLLLLLCFCFIPWSARPVHGRCNAATRPGRHPATVPLPCGILPLPCRYLADARPVPRWHPANARPPRIAATYHKATLPALGRCSANARPLLCQSRGRHLAGTSPVYLASTWLLLDWLLAATWPPPGRY